MNTAQINITEVSVPENAATVDQGLLIGNSYTKQQVRDEVSKLSSGEKALTLSISDSAPIEPGRYPLSDIGIYNNLGDIEALSGYANFGVLNTDGEWSILRWKIIDTTEETVLSLIGSNASYQSQKIQNVKIRIFQELNDKDVQFYIIQSGWLEDQKRFFFNAVLIIDGVNSGYLNFDSISKTYTSIPLHNEDYYTLISDYKGNIFGEISFTYDWESIDGDTADHLLNVSPADYLSQHIQYSYHTYESRNEAYTFDIKNTIKIDKLKRYGSEFVTNADVLQTGFIASIFEEPVTDSGILQRISFHATTSGKYTIGIGHLDHRNWYIETTQFDVVASGPGIQNFDVYNLGIEIASGDQPFIYTGKNGTETIPFETYGDAHDKQMMYGVIGQEIHPLEPTNFGGGIYLSYDIVKIDTFFATKREIANVQQNVNNVSSIANAALQNNGKIKDRTGKLYRMILDIPGTGEAIFIPMQFENVLIIGNSTTVHGSAPLIGWNANRGMAATNSTTDMAAILETAFKKKINTATVTRQTAADGGTAWEQTLSDTTETFNSMFAGIVGNKYDLIIFRLSENVTDLSSANMLKFKNSTKAMMNYLRNKWTKAEIIITSDVMDNNSLKNSALSSAATELGITYVEAGASEWFYKHKTSDGLYAPYYIKGDDANFYPAQNIFHTHPEDHAYAKNANEILKALGYDLENIIHDVTVTTSLNVKIKPKGIHNGIFTVLGYSGNPSTATVKDAENNNVGYQIKNMVGVDYFGQPPANAPLWALIFEMPNSNVTVAI